LSAEYAYQHVSVVNCLIYFGVFQRTNSFIPEMMVYVYQKILENEFWGMTNSGAALIGCGEQ